MKGLVVLGSTGSVGLQTLDIVRAFPEEFRVVGLAARRSFASLSSQVSEFRPKYISFEGTEKEMAEFASSGRISCSMEEMVAFPDVDLDRLGDGGRRGPWPHHRSYQSRQGDRSRK